VPKTNEDAGAEHYAVDDLTRIQKHLARPELDHSDANDAMIEGIHEALSNGRPLSEGEQNFMKHELTEADLMDGGMSYEDAHALALQEHPLGKNYTPEVIRRFPEFGPFYWRAWGMR
jgi:ribosome assembly protein YihI (activator of Der GTPase)